MNKPNRLTVILALVTFAVGWYLGSDDKGMTITSSVGGSGYGGGYEQQTQPIQDEGAVQPREQQGKTHVVNPGDSIQAAVEIAQPGDTIQVMPGTYSETVYIDKDDIHLVGVIVAGGTRYLGRAENTQRCHSLFW